MRSPGFAMLDSFMKLDLVWAAIVTLETFLAEQGE
jgi:hypothetical protein